MSNIRHTSSNYVDIVSSINVQILKTREMSIYTLRAARAKNGA